MFNFTESSVTWGVYGNPSMYSADVATVSPQALRLVLTSPPELVGRFYQVAFTNPGYPTGPETRSMSLAVPTGAQAPPANVADAMGNPDFLVFVLNQCNSWGSAGCDFSPAFQAQASIKSSKAAVRALGAGGCAANGDCTSCVGDASGVCGWCDGLVKDDEGNTICGDDGLGCCTGDEEKYTCDVSYRFYCPVRWWLFDLVAPAVRACAMPSLTRRL